MISESNSSKIQIHDRKTARAEEVYGPSSRVSMSLTGCIN